VKLSQDRILTTHVGSLPRSAAVVDLLYKRENGEVVDAPAYDAGSFAGYSRVDSAIVYKKLGALAEGAALRQRSLSLRRRSRSRCCFANRRLRRAWRPCHPNKLTRRASSWCRSRT
jgi:hypothetical protein